MSKQIDQLIQKYAECGGILTEHPDDTEHRQYTRLMDRLYEVEPVHLPTVAKGVERFMTESTNPVLAEALMLVLNRIAMQAIHSVAVLNQPVVARIIARDISRAVVLADSAFQGILEGSD